MNLVFNFDKSTPKYEKIDTTLIFKTNFKKTTYTFKSHKQ